jgi:hypothetical protein
MTSSNKASRGPRNRHPLGLDLSDPKGVAGFLDGLGYDSESIIRALTERCGVDRITAARIIATIPHHGGSRISSGRTVERRLDNHAARDRQRRRWPSARGLVHKRDRLVGTLYGRFAAHAITSTGAASRRPVPIVSHGICPRTIVRGHAPARSARPVFPGRPM